MNDGICPECQKQHYKIVPLYGQAMFPIQDGPDIPWTLIWPHRKQAELNHGQTLEQLAKRGGLGATEALAVIEDRKFEFMATDVARQKLAEYADNDPARLRAERDAALNKVIWGFYEDEVPVYTDRALEPGRINELCEEVTADELNRVIERLSEAVDAFKRIARGHPQGGRPLGGELARQIARRYLTKHGFGWMSDNRGSEQ